MEKRDGLKKQKKKQNFLFDILYDIKTAKTKSLLDDKTNEYYAAFNSFMIMKFLSMNASFLPYLDHVNQYYHLLEKRELYILLCDLIPYTKSFDPYTTKTMTTLENESYVSEYFQCSKKEAREYISICGDSWAEEVKLSFGGKA